MSRGSVLVIDDEYGVRTGIRQILEMEEYEVAVAETGREALTALEARPFDVVLIDYQLPDIDGLTLLQAVKSRGLATTTCMITAYANIDTAIAATRQGIDFFLPKPFSPDDLCGVVDTLLRHKRLKEEAERLQRENAASLRALATEKSQTRTLLACMRDAVLVVNRQNEVVLANGALAMLLGCSEEALLGRHVRDVLAPAPVQPLLQLLDTPPEQLERAAREIELGERSYAASVAAFRGETGEVLGRILTIADISDVRRMAMEKSRFIRTMVHEFRSPLGAIKSLIEVALDKSLGDSIDPYVDFLTRADARIDKLVALIGQLLSLSHIDLEARDQVRGTTAVAPAVEAAFELVRGRASAQAIALESEVAPELPLVAIGFEDLKSVLGNLVGNAVKYNKEHGRVRVTAAATRAAQGGTEVRLEISDTGLGIKAENLPHLFDEFFREKRPETRDIEGNGLGLSIVKRLVERAHGRVEVTSEIGKGTTFSLWLPAA